MSESEGGQMARSRVGTVLFHLVLLAIVLAFVGSALTLSSRAGRLPLLIGVPTALLLVLSLASEFVPALARRFEGGVEWLVGGQAATAIAGPTMPVEEQPVRSLLVGGAWFLLFFVLVLLLGFLAATAIFIPSFLILFARYPWWHGVLYTVAVLATEWYGLEVLLSFRLWRGAIPEVVPGVIGGDVLPPFF